MKTMKKFRTYLICFVAFYLLVTFLERGWIKEMYEPLKGSAVGTYTTEAGEENTLNIYVISADATNVNGNMRVKVLNTSGHDIDNCYAKVDLLDRNENVVGTEYINIKDLKAGESKLYDIKFHNKFVEGYKIAMVEKAPEVPANMVNIMGWEVDLSNVFGRDLSKYRNLFNEKGIFNGLKSGWDFSVAFAKRVPWWAYAVGAGIIAFYTPMGYMFGFVL